jgi:5-carboxymethyl-2-hydroxymuconic-semialdehyde dehydrogenase
VLNIVTASSSRRTMAPLISDPRLRKLSFTGSTEVGQALMGQAAENVLRLSMELGGNAPFLVFEDADLDAAAATAAYQYDNSGQVCLAGTRLLVQRSILEEFLARLRARVEQIVVGDPRDPATTYGPLIHPVALERVTGHVQRAIAAGATVAFGGRSLGGLYYAPTLFTDIPPGAEILEREVFGPVLTLQAFADEDDAIRLANATDYGLAATIYTGSESRADRVGAAVVAGTVWVNCFYVRDLETPFGGSRDSGVGREGGRHSFDFYCDVKTVCERTSSFTAS